MAYAKLGTSSDVFVDSDGNRLHCHWCRLSPTGATASYPEYAPMLAHLAEHQAQGHRVPAYVLEQLAREAAHSPIVAEVSPARGRRARGPLRLSTAGSCTGALYMP